MTPEITPASRLGAGLLIAALFASILHEFFGHALLGDLAGGFAALAIACFWPGVAWSRRAFVLIGLAVFAASVASGNDWAETALTGLSKAGFIAGFFTAMTSLRAAAGDSPQILECGRFLARQPPGRRYLALTAGGNLFGLILSYGAIALLGSLATEASAKEPDEEIRRHRTRRMLVAIQRGFVSTLPWSPLAFATAIVLSLVPGAEWAAALPYTAATGLLFAAVGWALDTIFNPKLSHPAPPRGAPEGAWLKRLRPLLILLGLLPVWIAALHFSTGVRIIGAVMLAAPLTALGWSALQAATGPGRLTRGAAKAARRAGNFVRRDLPSQRSEITLLVMAAFIGSVGGHLAAPIVKSLGLDLGAYPAALVLVGLFWLVPLTGQLGMNPILSASLIGPMLPDPAALGVSPALMAASLTAGWALSGATSPFTATTLLIGAYGGVTARRVGLGWNGLYALVCGGILSGAIALLALSGG